MDELLSEKEQIEAMRTWWRENGAYVIGGVVLGVAILLGWNQWKDYRLNRQLGASTLYETLANEVASGNLEASEAAANDLYENYASTSYSALARLAMARLYMDNGRDQDAADTLSALLDGRNSAEVQMVGRYRLAKIYLYQEKPQDVIDLLQGFEDTAFAARYAELLGDAHAALGQVSAAAAAYARAMENEAGAPTVNRALIQMKIVDLPDDDVAADPAETEAADSPDPSPDPSGADTEAADSPDPSPDPSGADTEAADSPDPLADPVEDQ